MKKTNNTTKKSHATFLILLLAMALAMPDSLFAQDQLALPVTFDDPEVEYLPMNDFAGVSTELGEDPEDPGNTVAVTTRSDTAQDWAGTSFDLLEPLSFEEGDTQIRIMVYSPEADINTMVKLEERESGFQSDEIQTTVTKADEWVELFFDFSQYADEEYEFDKIVVFFNYGTTGADAGEQVFYWDHVDFGKMPISLPVTFDDPFVEYLPMNDFAGNATVLGEDPEDPDNTVAVTTRSDSAEDWAGTTFNLGTPIPFSSGISEIRMNIYSPEADISVMMKLEYRADGTESGEIEVSTTQENEWEELVFDFSDHNDLDYDKIGLFFNYGTTGADAGEQVFYWDNIDIVGLPITLPVTFDDPAVQYFPMNDFAGVSTELAADPENSGNMVAATTKSDTALDWGGTSFDIDQTISFSGEMNGMTMNVYSPEADITVMMKLEQRSDGFQSDEIQTTVSEADTWEELAFDFSQYVDSEYEFDKIVVFFNYGTTGADAGEQLFYWDDVDMISVPTSITDDSGELPQQFSLEQNYPNPFNPTTSISFALPQQSEIDLSVYNMLGQHVATLASGMYQQGSHTVQFDAMDLASGVYLYRLQSENHTITNKMLLIK